MCRGLEQSGRLRGRSARGSVSWGSYLPVCRACLGNPQERNKEQRVMKSGMEGANQCVTPPGSSHCYYRLSALRVLLLNRGAGKANRANQDADPVRSRRDPGGDDGGPARTGQSGHRGTDRPLLRRPQQRNSPRPVMRAEGRPFSEAQAVRGGRQGPDVQNTPSAIPYFGCHGGARGRKETAGRK